MKDLFKNIISVLLVFLVIAALFTFISPQAEKPEQFSLNRLVEEIELGQVKKIIVMESRLEITLVDNRIAEARKEPEIALTQSLLNYGISEETLKSLEIEVEEKKDWSLSWIVILGVLPLVFFIIFFWIILRQAKGGAMQALDFSKARARLFGADAGKKPDVSFKDVAGLKEAKEELEEIVSFLKYPKKFLAMGAKIPKGVLLTGMPGTGKTLLARAVAGEAHVPFFSIAGSEFIELFVGVGSSRVRDLFNTAKKHQPCIIYIDELDAVGRVRGSGIGGGHDEREQTLNQILVEMDGFEQDSKIIVLSSTNRPDILDPALLRPGRFDRKVILDLPDIKDREAILQVHGKNKPLSKDIALLEIAERTPGFSGADLANLFNEAAILAARKNKKQIEQEDLLESIEKVLLGPERKSHILSKKEKEIAAYHEAGHALIATILPHTEPVRKISIIARGMAAGYTLKVPTEEKKIRSKSEFLTEISVLLGGYCTEKLIFKEITTGASNDLEKASDLARRLVKEYGMSSLGPISWGHKEELVFLGKEISEQRNYSEKVAALIDEEITKFIKEAETRTDKALQKHKGLLAKIAKTLIEKETIEREEFERIIKKEKIRKGA